MMAIPNMEKPKSCYACSFNDGIFCALIDNGTNAFIKENPTEVATKVLPDCPLIDIVRCEECKWFVAQGEGNVGKCKYRTRPILYCLPTDFCSYGERRADDERL